MATFYLVRHGAHDWLERGLAGRMPGVSLNALGARQANELAAALFDRGIQRILSSPRERAVETATPLARRLGLPVERADAFDEIDFGAWQGRTFADIQGDPQWDRYNRNRATARPPGGESSLETQSRVLGLLESLASGAPEETFALFGHGDPIKLAVLGVLGASVDAVMRLELPPAGVACLSWNADHIGVVSVGTVLPHPG